MKNPFRKINEMSTASAVIIAGLLISLSIFFTVYIFFGGINNRNKLFLSNPPRPAITRPTTQTQTQNKAPTIKIGTTTVTQ